MGRQSKYTAEFRREALALAKSSKRPVAEVARSMNMNAQTSGNWMRAARAAAERDADPGALSESEREELKRLRKENDQLTIDKHSLSKAAAYFARETNQ